MVIVDMTTPGITVRPLRQMTGDAHFNEVFLDEVRVPIDQALGETNGGWRVARTMLAFERQALGAMGSSGGGRGGFNSLVSLAEDRQLTTNPEVRQMLADLRIRQMVLRHLGGYLAARRSTGTSRGGEASLLKLFMARFVQDTAEVAVSVAGMGATAWETTDPVGGRWCTQLLSAQSASIGGGTNEIVRNVIAEQVLGLPKEVEEDAFVPHHRVPSGNNRDT